MKLDLVRTGNSRGIRIPKPLIHQCGLGDNVEVRVEENRIIISPGHTARDGWDEAFRAAGAATQDELLLSATRPKTLSIAMSGPGE